MADLFGARPEGAGASRCPCGNRLAGPADACSGPRHGTAALNVMLLVLAALLAVLAHLLTALGPDLAARALTGLAPHVADGQVRRNSRHCRCRLIIADAGRTHQALDSGRCPQASARNDRGFRPNQSGERPRRIAIVRRAAARFIGAVRRDAAYSPTAHRR